MMAKSPIIHFDYKPIKDCKHPEWTYGEICVKCNECGRFNIQLTCLNCGFVNETKSRYDFQDWGKVELYNGYFPICPRCRPLFKEEDEILRPYENKIIGCNQKDFKRRTE